MSKTVTIQVRCRCGKSESIEVREGYAGSAFDYCTYCDRERTPAQQKRVLEAWRKATA